MTKATIIEGTPLRLIGYDARRPLHAGITTGVESDHTPSATLGGDATEFGGVMSFTDIAATASRTIRPIATAIPWPYDDAGVAFPAGTKLLRTGTAPLPWQTLQSTSTAATNVQITVRKHYVGQWYRAVGIPAGSAGTLTVKRTASWNVGSTPVTTVATVSIPAGSGSEVWLKIPDISAPANLPPGNVVLSFSTVWTSGAPRYERVTVPTSSSGTVLSGCLGVLVPVALPAGFTARSGDDTVHGASPFAHPPQGPWPATSTPTAHPLMRGFARVQTTTVTTTDPLTVASGNSVGRRFGQPELHHPTLYANANDSRVYWPRHPWHNFPCFHSSGEVKEHRYMPLCFDNFVNSRIVSGSGVTIFASGSSGTRTGTEVELERGPGWREVRAWATGTKSTEIRLVLRRTATWAAGTPTVTIATMTWTGAPTSLLLDLGAAISPSPEVFDAVIYARVDFDYLTDAPSQTVGATVHVAPCRRCDIPPVFSAPTDDGNAVQGGYLPSMVATPGNLTTFQDVAGPGMVATFTGATSTARNLVARFRPPATGLYTIVSSPAVGGLLLGEYDFASAGGTRLIRGGRQAWGIRENNTVSGTHTWTLTAAAQTVTAIAAAGTTITAGMLSGGYFFGTIAIPAAGRYRVWVRIDSGSGVSARHLLAVTQSDAFAASPSTDEVARTMGLAFGVITAEQATPPGSPTHGAAYLVATGGTGAWLGRDGQRATWSSYRSAWHFLERIADVRYLATIAGVFMWYDPATGAWQPATANWIELPIIAAAAGTWSVRLQTDDDDTGNYSPNQGGTCAIGWDTL